MAVSGSTGADRARYLLNGIPDRFNEFCHMDQFTFVQLADWIVENVESSTAEQAISIEESLFVFLDIIAQGNSFKSTAYGWNHDVKMTQTIFLNVLNALKTLGEKEELSPDCPPYTATKSRWRILKAWRAGKTRMDGLVKVGDDNGDGLEIPQEKIIEAITALNNFIHERKEC
ncbi:hypothetical protein B0J11DRAFT_289350 [Dendryphion nanum]|uniref:DUF8040 domain-containing protein n=1 Tax=Dendryphion nanum TaxID=256645 RepID=A0A9P9DVE2_9PLEO|nr:hypothetical protein B0J11DRAFT_289350 [Dendryphion nanum]